MNVTRRQAAIGGLSLLASTSMIRSSKADFNSFFGAGEGLEDFWLATDAYIYGYSLVTIEMTEGSSRTSPRLKVRAVRWVRSSSCVSTPTHRFGT